MDFGAKKGKRLHYGMLFLISLFMAYGQTTTSSMLGKLYDENGQPVAAADIMAVHEPTGTQYWSFSLEDGRFNIPNMKVGGPYSVTVYHAGFQDQKQ